MCSKSENTETASTLVQQAQQQWQSTTDVATLELLVSILSIASSIYVADVSFVGHRVFSWLVAK